MADQWISFSLIQLISCPTKVLMNAVIYVAWYMLTCWQHLSFLLDWGTTATIYHAYLISGGELMLIGTLSPKYDVSLYLRKPNFTFNIFPFDMKLRGNGKIIQYKCIFSMIRYHDRDSLVHLYSLDKPGYL